MFLDLVGLRVDECPFVVYFFSGGGVLVSVSSIDAELMQ